MGWGVMNLIYLAQARGLVSGSCKHGNEHILIIS
jgi:hypothetical protein